MSAYSAEALYRLLPAIYRQRDAERGYPLRDLVELMAREAEIVEQDARRLYDNWFIETAEEWVVPYLGDLLGVTGIAASPGARFSRRAEVANTLHYRQGKGTARVLEELARDVTGWPARVVELFELLGTTQYLNHPRPHSLRTPDLRDAGALELLGGPFENAAHTAEVRRIAPRRGKYNIPNVGIYLWRLSAYPLRLTMPHEVDATARRYRFSPLGHDAPLFTHPAAESRQRVAGEIHVPAPIRRRVLHRAIKSPAASYYGPGLSLAIFDHRDGDGVWQPVDRGLIVACDLSHWGEPAPVGDRPVPAGRIAVDPALGRLELAPGTEPAGELRVSWFHGFNDDLGGGQYERARSFTEIAGERTIPVGEDESETDLAGALGVWGGLGSAVIEIRDSRTYEETPAVPAVAAGARLEIRAANGQRPCLVLGGDLAVGGAAGGGFELNGLLIAGGALRLTGDLERVTIQHTTLVPGRELTAHGEPAMASEPALIVDSVAAKVEIRRSILGAVRADPGAEVAVEDSFLDANDPAAAAYRGPGGPGDPGGALTVARSTVIGTVDAREMPLAENSIFLGAAIVERRQQGCVRFSHVPLGSRVPRRFRCQPAIPDDASQAEARRLAARVQPRFTSLRYADPGYGQLDWRGPREIRRGAEDESEMGAFSSLRQPQREDALRARLDEYLRVGLEAGIFYAS